MVDVISGGTEARPYPEGQKRQPSVFGSGRSNLKRRSPLCRIANDRWGRGPDVHDDVVDWLQRVVTGRVASQN